MKKLLEKVKGTWALSVVFAEETISLTPEGGLAGQLTGITIAGIVSALISLIIIIAAVVFFFILIIGGIRWIMSGGDKANTEAARNQITAALVGLVIVFAAWAILQLIDAFFGTNILGGLEIPTIQR
ncbi:hypothetical protein IID21_03495 [Patescibacteria group bacterium]|nr:hypothetical protein [Patescibacteria group bacterium]